MSRRRTVFLPLIALLLLAAAPFLLAQPKHEKSVWNYEGGLQLMTDGSLPQGPCFRLSGRATAPDYFDNLKRIDSGPGTILHRGNDIVTEFPAQLHLSFLMYDLPCEFQVQAAGTRTYLTHALVNTLHVSFFWKHGVTLRPATGVLPKHFETRPVQPYASDLADKLPEKFEWIFEFDVPSAGVPVTDSLVVIMRTPDGHIAARAAARM
ncbi:MAG: hypothetical protein WBL63_12300 [Candidatus Acidiferrum sp.]